MDKMNKMEYRGSEKKLSQKLLDVTNRKIAHAAKVAFVKNKMSLIVSSFCSNQLESAKNEFYDMVYDTIIEEDLDLKKATLCSYVTNTVFLLCENVVYPYTLYQLQCKKINVLFQLSSHEEVNNWCDSIIEELFVGYQSNCSLIEYKFSERILMFIHNNYQKPIGLQEIADSIYASPSYMCRKFKKETGMTILEYMTNFRLIVASELLLSTNMQVGKICTAVGYSSQEVFLKAFKKKYGLTCSQYRKSKG